MRLLRRLLDVSELQQLPKSQRRIVFYSEGKANWPHLEGLLQEFLKTSSIPVCYVSSSIDDPGLTLQHPNLRCFQIDEGWIRNWLFANIDTDVMVMTMPDLHQYQVKRSKHPVHYVYAHHSLVSCHMIYRPGAFDYYDTILCAGPHHVAEIRNIEYQYDLPEKKLIEHGYGRLDAILANRDQKTYNKNHKHLHVLIAPSWGEHGIIEMIGNELVTHLLDCNYQVTLRPHPQTLKFAKAKVQRIHKQHQSNPLFTLETNVASQDSLHQSDIMISDWSGAALDYAFGLEKPVIFIDVPRKINNPDYQAIDILPFEVHIRDKIGAVVPMHKMDVINNTIREVIDNHDLKSQLAQLREQHVFNINNSGSVGAKALVELLV